MKELTKIEMKDEDLFEKIATIYENETPFVAYNKPNCSNVNLIVQKNSKLYETKEYKESGFVFAPFDTRESTVLFPKSQSVFYNCGFYNTSTKPLNYEQVTLREMASKSDHIQLVIKGIDFLNKSHGKKVVLSRRQNIKNDNFDMVKTFKKLIANYASAFVYCWYHPKVGLWLGATPENLLKVEKNRFSTMALAATQVNMNSNTKNSDFNAITWGSKEIAEQQFVTDFIIKQLNTNVEVSKPYTIKAGNLLHLRTDISGLLSAQLDVKNIINLLHPTPAVCGLPKAEAKKFILENENYNRQFYTGFLGELNLNTMSDLYVNLRCMQVLQTNISIYIGGGITKESNPESEWEETVAKSKILLKVIE